MDWNELVLHPVRLRVLQHLRSAGEATAKEIATAMEDVPRATVYRHVKALEEAAPSRWRGRGACAGRRRRPTRRRRGW